MDSKLVIDLFVSTGFIDRVQGDDLLIEIENSGKQVEQVILDFEIVTKEQFYQTIADAIGSEYYDMEGVEIPVETQRLIPGGMARLHGALPVASNGGTIAVAVTNPLDPQLADELRFSLGKEIQVVVSPVEQIEERLRQYYSSESSNFAGVLEEMRNIGELSFGESNQFDTHNAEAEANATPIIKFVDLVLYQAIQDRASDIHFEPFESEFKIRYRVDGALYEVSPPPRHLALSIISRVKVMANLNIAERRLPQDGRIQKNIGGRQVDLRVSTLPTQFGESVVLRVLDRSTVTLDIEALGLPPRIHSYILKTIEKPNGIFIVTGPTGSGKTTTLYSCLRKINTMDSKLLTAEDPVEYDIDGIVQVPVNEAIGLTFARVLRAFLRQDPDRIMVGETRDLETAQIAIQAALTGHLVLTTLHTNDAAGVVTRLMDMGVEPFLISSSLEAILAQRLIRKICTNCRTPYEPSEALLAQMGLSPHEIGDKNFYYGKGCETCNHTGYKGRKGIYELLDITDPIRELINSRAPTLVLKQKAIELGMTTLRDDGLRSIYDGETTIEEVLKYT